MVYFSYSINHKKKLNELAEKAINYKQSNIAFNCYIQTNNLEKCVEILLENDQISEACLFCRTYLPSKLPEMLEKWNKKINDNNTIERISNNFILDIKILNPLENLDSNNLLNIESELSKFYSKIDKLDISCQQTLSKLEYLDLEKEFTSEIDLMKLLEINESEIKEELKQVTNVLKPEIKKELKQEVDQELKQETNENYNDDDKNEEQEEEDS